MRCMGGNTIGTIPSVRFMDFRGSDGKSMQMTFRVGVLGCLEGGVPLYIYVLVL